GRLRIIGGVCEQEHRLQQGSEGRHRAGQSLSTRQERAKNRARSRSAAAWYRWFAVFGLVASIGIVLGYTTTNHAQLTGTTSGTVPLLGSSVLSEPDLHKDTGQFGRMPIVRVYYPGLPSSNAWTSGMAAANHSAVIVSFKALPKTILSGADDTALRHFFNSAPRTHPIYWSYYHEPEDNIADGQFNAADYKAAWAHIVSLARAAHNPALHSTLILMSWDLVKASHRNWRNYLPGGGIISVLGWDAYPVGSATNVHPQLTPPGGFMGPAIAASKSVHLPYGFPEFGLSTPRGRPGWLRSVGNYILHSGALFAAYFNGNQQYPTLRLTDSASIRIWRGFVAQSRNGDPRPVPPSPTPTPSPSTSAPSASSAVSVTGLSLSPGTVSATSQDSATLSFKLSRRANVTVCVLNASGKVVRTVARPGAAGSVTIRYLVHKSASHGLAAGQYTVLVVASNSGGSATGTATLSVG
ncbi:MAG: FlgD immunoglobulin-like domain containing protein, partial [Streptosporangiaceae bacterium]